MRIAPGAGADDNIMGAEIGRERQLTWPTRPCQCSAPGPPGLAPRASPQWASIGPPERSWATFSRFCGGTSMTLRLIEMIRSARRVSCAIGQLAVERMFIGPQADKMNQRYTDEREEYRTCGECVEGPDHARSTDGTNM